MAYRRARPGQAQALPGLQARARLDPREFGQAGPGFTEAWPAWPVGNTDAIFVSVEFSFLSTGSSA